MNNFRSAIQDCDLSDLGYIGRWYTWEKGHFSASNIRERLDRGLASPSWWSLFPDFTLRHLSHTISDHCPLLVDTMGNVGPSSDHTLQGFRFDANWLLEPDFEKIVEQSWNATSDDVPSKLSRLAVAVKKWCRSLKGRRNRQRSLLQSRLEELSMADPGDEVLAELLDVKLALNLEDDKDELFWEQRARVNWLKCGDRNTQFFHSWASFRRKKNRISKLKRDDGSWESHDEAMASIASTHFQQLFTAQQVDNPNEILRSIRPSITRDDNVMLRRQVTKDEIFCAVK
ncbi:hypothetical protein HRI_004732800 [Hibiscus trionum]|uniref:Reverse transcriptase n=1 Tax=Hibiscus trionum TaxID=183268 RepID=A0A9W7J9V5_HIBTR|nr:hypothetical protein HRI_004732800 [Hibiscus trionum]